MTIERIPLADRFWPKVSKGADPGACWLWIGGTDSNGYGKITAGGHHGKMLPAHRVSYELVHGPISEGLELDHLCEVRACVNPAHLEPVTHHDNLLRGTGQRTHCRYGHPLDGLMVPNDKRRSTRYAQRYCKTCNRERARARRAAGRQQQR